MYNLNPSVMFLASLARSKDHLDKLTSKNGVYLGYVFFLTGSVLHFLGTVTPHWAGGTDGYAGVWYMCNVTGGKDNCHSYPDSESRCRFVSSDFVCHLIIVVVVVVAIVVVVVVIVVKCFLFNFCCYYYYYYYYYYYFVLLLLLLLLL